MNLPNWRMLRFLLVSSILLSLLAACSASPTQPTQAVEAGATKQPAETADPGMGAVVGTLKYKGKPLSLVTLGLANVIKDAQGLEVATQFDRAFSPQTSTQANGSFEFLNLKPGRYGLIYANGPETYLLLKPGDPNIQEAILMTVTAGQKVDLGVLDFDNLPDQGK